VAKFLLLETSDHGPRKSTIPIPAASLGSGITPRHPPQELPIVNHEVGVGELVRVEKEWRDAKRQDRKPEVDQMGDEERHGGVEQEEEVAHAHINARSREPGVEDGEVHASSREPTSSCDVARSTECEITQDGLRVDLG